MSKNNLFKSMFALLFAFAAVAFVGCKEDIEDVQAPELTVAPAVLNFDELGGSETVQLTANCDWSIAETPSWVDIQPMSGSGNTTLTVTTYPKNENQKLVVYFTLYHPEYGMWGKSKNTLTINQTYGGEPIVEDIFYSNDFDKEPAEKTYGSSSSSWPYLDQFDGWQNHTGTGVENVTYSYMGMSARNNSNSDGSYSDYPGSGVNNMFFGSGAYLQIENIAITSTNVNLTFGGEKYLNGSDNLFKPEEFLITLSADGENWSAPISYTQPEGAGRWNVGSADFTLPEGTTTLWIKFEATVASAYRIDDVKLMGGLGGQQITFDGGSVTPPGPGPQPTDAIYSNDFDKVAADKTYGSGESWPYLDQFDGWQNETGSGAANVTYDYKGASARNNSNSDGSYSDYAGSGVNNIFFGTNAYLTIGNIALETNKLNLTFGGEKYLQGSDNTFSTSEFTITLSADGTNWSAPIEYTAPAGQGRWNVGSADFTIPEGTKTLYIKFEASVASAYRIDDVKLVAGNGGQEVNLEGGETPGPGPQPTDAIYSNDFDKAAADKTYGSGSSWPYLDQFDGWQNETGSGAANVTYDYKGASARNNSNSDGSYSDYAGSGVNNIFFGTNAYLTIGNIALETTKLNLTFGGEKYLQGSDNTFSTSEFTITLSADGQNWSAPIEYTAPAGQGRWNVGSADFTLPEGTTTLYIKFEASVASAYRIDDVKLMGGLGGQQITFDGGTVTPPTPPTGEIPEGAVEATIQEFLDAAEDDTIYVLTGEISRVVKEDWGNFDLTDETATVYIYGLLSPEGEKKVQFQAAGLKQGDKITLYGKRSSYNGEAQMADATYVSHTSGGGEQPGPGGDPVPAEGDYASDAAFVCTGDSYSNPSGLGDTTIGGQAATGFKLGTGKLTGAFTSAAVGVSGDKYLNFYAVAWKGKSATLYVRVDGTQVAALNLNPNDGATGNPPYVALAPTANDYYSVKLSGLTASSVVEFSTSANFTAESNTTSGRAIAFGVKLTDEALAPEQGGGQTPEEPEQPEEPEEPTTLVKATVQEFLNAAEDETIYELTGEITGTYNTTYGNFYLKDSTGEVLIYGLLTPEGESQKQYTAAGLKDGDIITLQTVRTSYNGTPQGKNAIYVSHTPAQGGGNEEPEQPVTPAEGDYASDAAFVCTGDSYSNPSGLGDTTIGGQAATGFKLGTGKLTGAFTSAAVGVSGDKTLSFYAVAWKGKTATLYVRVEGVLVAAINLNPNDGATGNPPYVALAPASIADYYTVALSGLTASSVVEFSTSANFTAESNTTSGRAIVCGVKLN